MRISDWSSDVCSSDLGLGARQPVLGLALKLRITDEDRQHHLAAVEYILGGDLSRLFLPDQFAERAQPFGQCGAQPRFVRAARRSREDRKRVVTGRREEVRVDLGGGRTLKKKKK